MMVHIKSDTGGELPPRVLNHIGKFTETLHKIHTFVEAQQVGSKVKNFFRQGEMSRLLNECKAGLQQGYDIFEVDTLNIMNDITKMQEDAEKRHKEVLDMIEALSDTQISRVYSGTHNSSKLYLNLHATIKPRYSMAESQNYQTFFSFWSRITQDCILGGGGMGKTSLARAVIHHSEIAGNMSSSVFLLLVTQQHSSGAAALIGTHLGLKPGKT
ncbi:hypothetical protein B0H13DRAFT_1894497 [Mycena leptocephala]|nr:hypothetical protein B0H13DRAFT_1894497 [Mycena leptocephala]